MSILTSNVPMKSNGDLSIPQVVTLTFENGAEVKYARSTEEHDNITGKTGKPSYSKPQLDLGEEKIDEHTFEALWNNNEKRLSSLNDQHRAACDEIEQTFAAEKKKLDEFYKSRTDELEKLRDERGMEISANFKELEKKLVVRKKMLSKPAERIKIMIQWLRSADIKDFWKVADILESESKHIIRIISASESVQPEEKWDNFFSHVQKSSGDLCRSLVGSLQKEGISTWYDKEVLRVDNVGMIKGVVHSSLFTLVLTTEYFTRPYCLYELCIAAVAEKPVMTLFEADPRFGGEHLSSYKVPELFGHIMKHEIIRIDRDYWAAFTEKVTKRIRNTLKLGLQGPEQSSILEELEITWLKT
jgi:hypothetical protein